MPTPIGAYMSIVGNVGHVTMRLLVYNVRNPLKLAFSAQFRQSAACWMTLLRFEPSLARLESGWSQTLAVPSKAPAGLRSTSCPTCWYLGRPDWSVWGVKYWRRYLWELYFGNTSLVGTPSGTLEQRGVEAAIFEGDFAKAAGLWHHQFMNYLNLSASIYYVCIIFEVCSRSIFYLWLLW